MTGLNVYRAMLSSLYIVFSVLFTVLACHLVVKVGYEIMSFTSKHQLVERYRREQPSKVHSFTLTSSHVNGALCDLGYYKRALGIRSDLICSSFSINASANIIRI